MLKGKKNKELKQVYKNIKFHDSFFEYINKFIFIYRAAFELKINLKFKLKKNSIIVINYIQ